MTLRPSFTRGGTTHTQHNACAPERHLSKLCQEVQSLLQLTVQGGHPGALTRVYDGGVMFSTDTVWDFELVPRLSVRCESKRWNWASLLRWKQLQKNHSLGNVDEKRVVNSHVEVLIGAGAALPINTVSQMTIRAGNNWYFWINPKAIQHWQDNKE